MLAERKRSLERDRGQLLDAGVVANLEADAARFQAELEAVAQSLGQVAPDAEALAADEEAYGAERERVLAALAEAEEGGGGSRAAAAAAEVRSELRTTRAALGNLAALWRRLDASDVAAVSPLVAVALLSFVPGDHQEAATRRLGEAMALAPTTTAAVAVMAAAYAHVQRAHPTSRFTDVAL